MSSSPTQKLGPLALILVSPWAEHLEAASRSCRAFPSKALVPKTAAYQGVVGESGRLAFLSTLPSSCCREDLCQAPSSMSHGPKTPLIPAPP